MTRHLADHQAPSDGGRLKHFLRIARAESAAVWHRFARPSAAAATGNRRVVEFVRIARGRLT